MKKLEIYHLREAYRKLSLWTVHDCSLGAVEDELRLKRGTLWNLFTDAGLINWDGEFTPGHSFQDLVNVLFLYLALLASNRVKIIGSEHTK